VTCRRTNGRCRRRGTCPNVRARALTTQNTGRTFGSQRVGRPCVSCKQKMIKIFYFRYNFQQIFCSIADPRSDSKNLSIFKPKIFSKLSDVHPGSIGIQIFPNPGSGSRIQSLKGTGSQHWFLCFSLFLLRSLFPFSASTTFRRRLTVSCHFKKPVRESKFLEMDSVIRKRRNSNRVKRPKTVSHNTIMWNPGPSERTQSLIIRKNTDFSSNRFLVQIFRREI
jgi:hypothetical protein